jgi:hypothetical protein
MNTLYSKLWNQDLVEALGLEAMNEVDRLAFIEEMGTVVLERAILTFVSLLSEEEQDQFEHFTQSIPEDADLIAALQKEYPAFLLVLESTMRDFKIEVLQQELITGA